jgi:chromosome segregation ATPase
MPIHRNDLSARRACPALRMSSLALLATLVSACTGTDDPRQGGFFDGVSNVFSGGYDRRIEREQAALGQEMGQQSQLQTRAVSLEQTRREQQQEIRKVKRQIGDLEKRLDAARKRQSGPVHTASQTDSFTRAEIQLASLQTRVQHIERPDRINDDVAKDLKTMNDEISDLSALVSSLD